MKDGQVQQLWVDAQTFLETKIQGAPRRLDGKYHPTAIYYRDYRPANGLMVPHVLETTLEGIRQTEKIEIEKVEVNRSWMIHALPSPNRAGRGILDQ